MIEQLTVLSFKGAGGIGASAANSAASGAPTVSLTASAAGSLTYATGNDYDKATGRTVGPARAWFRSGLTPAPATRTGRRAQRPQPPARARR